MRPQFPILEFDGERDALIEPSRIVARIDIPERSPLAAGAMEELIAMVPTAAVRDEGTSYHYVPPSREIVLDTRVGQVIESVLGQHGVIVRLGKTWTTDAFYRETHTRIATRKADGCLTVEMECAALAAVAQFRGVTFGQLPATGDDVSGDRWDARDWGTDAHVEFSDKLFWLAVESCLAL